MNFNPRKSLGRNPSPNLKGQVLYTLPSELPQKQLEFEDLDQRDTLSVEMGKCESLFPTTTMSCASPTFATQASSLHSYNMRLEKDKENRPINRQDSRSKYVTSTETMQQVLRDSRLLKGANNKLGEKIKELENENKHMKGLLEHCKKELERKLMDNGLQRFFQADNSGEVPHIDIYLQLQAVKARFFEQQKDRKKEMQKLEAIIQKLGSQNAELRQQAKDKDKGQQQVVDKKLRELEQKLNQFKQINGQLEQKRQQLIKRNKELEEQLKSKNVGSQELKDIREELQYLKPQYEAINLENQKNKQLIRKQDKKLEHTIKEKQRLAQQVEEEKNYNSCLKSEISNLEATVSGLKVELAKSISELKSFKQELELKSFESNRDREQAQVMRIELTELRPRVAAERQAKDRAIQDRQRATQQRDRVVQDRDRLAMELDQFEEKHRYLEEELAKKQEQLSSQRASLTRQTNNSMACMPKLRQILRNLREGQGQSKYDSVRSKKYANQEYQLDMTLNEINSLVNSLLQQEHKGVKEYELVCERIEALEKEREQMIQAHNFEVSLKQEAIKKLNMFVPVDAVNAVQEYLYLMEQLLVHCTNDLIQKKADVLEDIGQIAHQTREQSRYLQDMQKKYMELRAQYDQLKRNIQHESKRVIQQTEVNRKQIKKKYFE